MWVSNSHFRSFFLVWLLLQHFSSQHSGLKMSKKCKQIILKVRICVGQYPTQLTVTLQNCRKIWSSIFVTFLVFFALFFANSFTVMVALVAKPLVLPSQWTLLQKIVQKTLEMWLKLLQTFLQFSNVTVSCVKYHFNTDSIYSTYLIVFANF